MTLFITSSPSVCMDGAINPKNDFLDELYRNIGNWTRCAFVSANPYDAGFSDHCGYAMKEAFEDVDIHFLRYDIIDCRTVDRLDEILHNIDFLIFGGGHVPTQNRFLNDTDFARRLRGFTGVVMGISAGSMNLADVVYACPEEAGETSPEYKRFLKGLGLTRSQILPHYYMEKDMKIDGLRLYEDVCFPDSIGKRFYAMPDGSYILSVNGIETMCGEAYIIENGSIRQFCEDGEKVRLDVCFL